MSLNNCIRDTFLLDEEKIKGILGSNNVDTQVMHGGMRENIEMWFLTEYYSEQVKIKIK